MLTVSHPHTRLQSLTCSVCHREYSIAEVQSFATCCNQPLVAGYDLVSIDKSELLNGRQDMWRYAAMLPVRDEANIISLGEGMTPIFPFHQLADRYGFQDLRLKDESSNPTGSFKARGISVAVSKARELGIRQCIIPTAGNAGGALAAYCARAGMDCTVVMPTHTPNIFKQECELYGARLVLVKGLINDCAREIGVLNKDQQYFDVSTLKEPYRLEGKKTMGYEIAEQYNWELPDVILYPAGGGTGLIGIWKAFREMQAMGWLTGKLPRMYAVQSSECAPILQALIDPQNWKTNFEPHPTLANGLAVPYPFGMDMMLAVIHESGGGAIAIEEKEIVAGVKEIARIQGLLISPEGAATWKALQMLHQQNKIAAHEKVLLLNTGTGYKYLDNLF